MILASTVSAGGYMGIVDRAATLDTLPFQFAFLDSLGSPIAGAAGDSVYIVVASPNGTVAYRDSTQGTGSLIVYTKEDHPDTYGWAFLVSVLDGAATSNGIYSYSITAIDVDLELGSYENGSFQIINGTLDNKFDSSVYAQEAVTAIGLLNDFDNTSDQVIVTTNNDKTGYTASTVSDKSGYSLTQAFPANFSSFALDGSGYVTVLTNNDKTGYALTTQNWNVGKTGYTLTQTFPTNFADLGIKVSTGEVIVDFDNSTGTISDAQVDDIVVTAGTVSDKTGYTASTVTDKSGYSLTVSDWATAADLTRLDSLSYEGAVWVDGGANTGTTIGIDGTSWNPVQDIATAKTIADALGIKVIKIVDGANETLAATMNDYHFIGIGSIDNVTMALGGQDVDGSTFENMIITGIQGGTGLMGVVNAAFTSADSLEVHARNCALVGDVSLRGTSSSYFDACYSAVAGNGTPAMNFNTASTTIDVSVRHYSGGLEVQNMTSNHTISYESDGQIVVNANCTSGNLTLRGNMTITDAGTTTAITKDAVYSKADVLSWLATDTTTAGTFWRNIIWASDSANWASMSDLLTYETYGDSRWAFEVRSANVDTLIYGTGATIPAGDTLGYTVFWHDGGASGDPPDSVRSYTGTPGE